MNKRLIILIGESASGKSSLERMLQETGQFKKAVSHTTRPMREGEIDGVDYHFITDEQFIKMLENNELLERAVYNNWNYGVSKKEITDSEMPVVLVVEPHGYKQIKDLNEFDITSFYVFAEGKARLLRSLTREENPDCKEICRRFLSDEDTFKGIVREVDFVIDNGKDRYMDDVLNETIDKINSQN